MVRARLKYNFDFSAVTEYKDERTNDLPNNVGDGHGQMGCKIGEKTLEGEHYFTACNIYLYIRNGNVIAEIRIPRP
jgi:hypothetical protein